MTLSTVTVALVYRHLLLVQNDALLLRSSSAEETRRSSRSRPLLGVYEQLRRPFHPVLPLCLLNQSTLLPAIYVGQNPRYLWLPACS